MKFCHASLIGQCCHLLKIKHLKLNPETQGYLIDMNEAEAFADHVVQYSLAGIRAMRRVMNENEALRLMPLFIASL